MGSMYPLYYRETGQGAPLLLVHGLMITGDMFEPLLGSLASRYRILIPDLRGHGRSGHLPGPYTVARMAEDLAQLLGSLNITSAAVLGYSQGGAIAQQLAADHPQTCAKLVLGCTYAFNRATARERIEGRLVPLLIRLLGMKRFARLILSTGLNRLTRERARWVAGLIGNQDRERMIAAWKAAMAFDGRPRLREIRCPTLVVAGSRDTAVPLHHARMLHEGIAGSRLTVLNGAGHDLIWDRPAELARAASDFIG